MCCMQRLPKINLLFKRFSALHFWFVFVSAKASGAGELFVQPRSALLARRDGEGRDDGWAAGLGWAWAPLRPQGKWPRGETAGEFGI